MAKLDEILLVDDDDADNFLHARIIRKVDCTHEVTVRDNGRTALDYLTTPVDGRYPCPDIIFLDINMPVMNGWEFLDEYERLDPSVQADMVVVMLTTSLNPDDAERARQRPMVSGFRTKPLTREMLIELLREHFPHVLE